MSAPEIRLYTLGEAAEALGVKETWLAEQLRARKLPARKICRQWKFTVGDLESAIEIMASPALVTAADPSGVSTASRRRLNSRRRAA